MKKTLALLALGAFTYGANAQELSSKKGFPILPEAGDWSISFDAVPLLDFAFDKTRFMSSSPASSASGALDYNVVNTIVGKYMIDANKAYRGKVRLGFDRASADNYLPKDGSTTGETVKDNAVTSQSNITLGAGLQYYRGKGRLRGYYGAEAELGISTAPSTTFSYGNAMSAENQAPTTTTDFVSGYTSPLSQRVTSIKGGMGFGIGARGFIGAEYFFAPKMSVGAEFGWGLGFGMSGEGERTTEEFDEAANALKTKTIKTGGSSRFNMDVDNAGGSINFAIYF